VRKFLAYFSTGMWILLGVGLVLVALMVWLILPLRHPDPPAYQPENAVAMVVVDLDNDSDATQLAIELARERLAGSDPGAFARLAFSVGSSLAMPRQVAVWVTAGEDSVDPRYLAVASLDRGGRIIRLLGRGVIKRRLLGRSADTVRINGTRVSSAAPEEDSMMPTAFAFTSDSLLVASDFAMIRDVLAPGPVIADEATFAQTIRDNLPGPGEISALGFNASGEMTGLVRAAEEKYAFAAMPSVDALSGMVIRAGLTEDAASGSAVFSYADRSRLDEGRSDVRYLYGVIRRLLRPMGLDMDAEITVDDGAVTLAFAIPGLVEHLRTSGSASGGNADNTTTTGE
jgi:hypothetical protein